jgi:hypothetical protein
MSLLIRLHPNIAESWEWWPRFERRLQAKAATLTPHTPIGQLIPMLRAWWGSEPWRFLALAQIDEDTMELDAHLLAWLEEPWGQVVALIQQIEADRELSNEAHRFGLTMLCAWFAELHGMNIFVHAMRFASKRHNGWVAWLNRIAHLPPEAISDEGHIMRLDAQAFIEASLLKSLRRAG